MKFKIISSIVFLLCVFIFSTPQQTHAQIPFGGRIITTYECACSGGWFMLIYDQYTKLPIPMVFQFGYSMMRANYNIYIPSVPVLGSYTPGGWCQVASSGCFGGFPVQGTVSPIGLPGIGTGAI